MSELSGPICLFPYRFLGTATALALQVLTLGMAIAALDILVEEMQARQELG